MANRDQIKIACTEISKNFIEMAFNVDTMTVEKLHDMAERMIASSIELDRVINVYAKNVSGKE